MNIPEILFPLLVPTNRIKEGFLMGQGISEEDRWELSSNSFLPHLVQENYRGIRSHWLFCFRSKEIEDFFGDPDPNWIRSRKFLNHFRCKFLIKNQHLALHSPYLGGTVMRNRSLLRTSTISTFSYLVLSMTKET